MLGAPDPSTTPLDPTCPVLSLDVSSLVRQSVLDSSEFSWMTCEAGGFRVASELLQTALAKFGSIFGLPLLLAVASILISSVELILDILLRFPLVSSLPPLIRLRQLASSLPVTRGNVSSLPVTDTPSEVVVRVLGNIVSLTSFAEVELISFCDAVLVDVTGDVTGNITVDVTTADGDVIDDDITVGDAEAFVNAFTAEESVGAPVAKLLAVSAGDVVSTVGSEVELFTIF